VTDPTGPRVGDHRIARGGSWEQLFRYARVAHRGWDHPERGGRDQGFRLARTLR